jgi:hypothetical protein
MKRLGFLQKFDMFGKKVELNFNGKPKHTSVAGGIFSILAFIPILVYFGQQM